MCYLYILGFKIHQVPRNTVTEQIYHITIRNLGITFGPFFFFQEGVLEEDNALQNFLIGQSIFIFYKNLKTEPE